MNDVMHITSANPSAGKMGAFCWPLGLKSFNADVSLLTHPLLRHLYSYVHKSLHVLDAHLPKVGAFSSFRP
jgi:hypothetical protein